MNVYVCCFCGFTVGPGPKVMFSVRCLSPGAYVFCLLSALSAVRVRARVSGKMFETLYFLYYKG